MRWVGSAPIAGVFRDCIVRPAFAPLVTGSRWAPTRLSDLKRLPDFLNQPQARLAMWVQSQTHQGSMAFPKTYDGDPLASHPPNDSLGSAHGSRRRLIGGAQRGKLIFIIGACRAAARRWKGQRHRARSRDGGHGQIRRGAQIEPSWAFLGGVGFHRRRRCCPTGRSAGHRGAGHADTANGPRGPVVR